MSAADTANDVPLPARKKRFNRNEVLAALIFVLPFVVVYAVLFIYPTLQMIWLSFHKAPLIGPGLAVPFSNGRLLTGEWQQIVLIDFDTRPRRRTVIGSVIV